MPSPAGAASLLAFDWGWRLKPQPDGCSEARLRAREKIPDSNHRAELGLSTPRYSLREGVTLPAGFR